MAFDRAKTLRAAEKYLEVGKIPAAIKEYCKIVDLDPHNTDIRIKLADAYLKEGMKQEAVASFAEAGERLMAAGAFERALEIYQKSLGIDPVAHATLKGLLATHSARGTPDEAVEIIERASSNNPDDCEILSTLANAYIEAEEAAEAERITAALVAKDSFSYLRFVEVANLYLKIDKLEDAVRVIETVAV